MNLSTTLSLYAGGPGSGCNPEKGRCGRPRGSGGTQFTERQKERLLRKYAPLPSERVPGRAKQGTVEREPIRRSAIRQQFRTSEGATYTLIKSPKARGVRAPQKPLSRASRYKGKFRYQFETRGLDPNRIVDSFEAVDARTGRGQGVMVHRDYAQKTYSIQEFTFEGYRQVARTGSGASGGLADLSSVQTYRFKNYGQAMGFLNRKYGIRLALPKRGKRVS